MADKPKTNPKLSPEQKRVLFAKGTEAPFTGKFLNNKTKGMYVCANCGASLFSSDTKFESTTPGLIGWPAFSKVADTANIRVVDDLSMGMVRQEIVCAKCGGHLGHLFDDSSSETNKHYCVNSLCLDFKPEDDEKA